MTQLLAILGPTAAGKTRMAVDVAIALGTPDHDVEIVSCDSMAIYNGLDVLAAKPPAGDRALVTHHLLDVVDASVEFTVHQYRKLAREAIADIASRGAVPMLVGGSGLYFRGVVDELSFAPTSPALRARLEQEDPDKLYEQLREADPGGVEHLDPRNVRRVVRAVEILELTGKRPSEVQREWRSHGERYTLTAIGLTWERGELFERVRERVRRQLDAGLVDEVRSALAGGLSKTAAQALGMKEVVAHLEGRATVEDVEAELVRNSKTFVRRQESWFRADPRIEWLNVSRLGWGQARDRTLERFSSAVSRPSGPGRTSRRSGRPAIWPR